MPVSDTERARRRALLDAHYDAENDHDLDRTMQTFSEDGVMPSSRSSRSIASTPPASSRRSAS